MLPISKKNTKKGFSMVELIIALAITSIALIAIYNLFITQQRTFRIQEEVANMQQNNRVAMENLSTIIKMAGSGVSAPQPKIIYCDAYDFVYNSDINGVPNDVMAFGAPVAGGSYTAPDPSGYVNQNAESYRWTIDRNDDGNLTSADLTNTTAGANHYSLWRIMYTGTTSSIDEVSPNISLTDLNGNDIVIFQYWGYFDADDNLDLFGDLNEDDTLDAAEITAYIGGSGVTDLTMAGRSLDDMLQMVDIKIINETHKRDPNYPSNAGFRQISNSSTVTPRNLWACNIIETVSGYPNTLKVTGDNTSFYGNIEFKVTEAGIPVSGAVVNFSATIGGTSIITYGGTISANQVTSNSNGIVNVDISIPGCSANFPIGGQISVTATLPSVVTPFGPCAADADIATITLVAGDPDHIAIIMAPTVTTLFTCGETATVSSLEIEVQDICDNAVPPTNPVNFDAFRIKNGSCTGLSGFGTVTATWTTPEKATITYTSPLSGPYDADRTAGNTDQFYAKIVDDFNGAFDCASPLATLNLETFPDSITNFDPLTNPITTTDHTDCNAAGLKNTDATFNIKDSCGNLVYDLNQLTLQIGADVTATFDHDPNGVFTNPKDQGYINAATPATDIITTATYPAGNYTVTYTDPNCTLPPLYTRILNPTITLTANNFRSAFAAIPFNFNLHSCSSCEVITSNPILLNCVPTDVTTNITTVTVVFCGIADGTPLELVMTSSAGATANASFDPNDPNISTVSSTFMSSTFTQTVYQGNAINNATLSMTAYSPSLASYNANTPDSFKCEAVNLITVQSNCAYIRTYNEVITGTSVEITTLNANDNLFIEVEDCNQNKDASAIEYIQVIVTSPQGYSPPAPDIEEVWLTETGADTGIFDTNVYYGPSNDPGPLPVIYCGLGASGDTSYNGRLFIRPGYDVQVQYTDPDDPADSACVEYLSIGTYSCPAFVYSYFANSYIHLDRHGISAYLSLGGNIFTNGELEISGDMLVDSSGPDGINGTVDDYSITSLGHASIAAVVTGNIFAPSFDLFGPDGQGQNGQNFAPNEGDVTGSVILMNGFRFESGSSTYIPEVIGSRGNPPSYGNYTSLAAATLYTPPPGSAVAVHAKTGAMVHNPNPSTGVLFESYNGPSYDPNLSPNYALPYSQGGRVLVAKEMPTFDYSLSITKAQDMSTAYHTSEGRDTYFTSMAEFETYLKTARVFSYTDPYGTPTTYSSPHANPEGFTIYIVGDPEVGTVFHFPNGFDTTQFTTITPTDQIIIHGMVVSETIVSIKDGDGGFAIYACGDRPVDWINGWTGATYLHLSDWQAVRGGTEAIPYDLIAFVAKTKFENKSRTAHSVTQGIVYCEGESHFHNQDPAGKAFLNGAQIANLIHNCLYMDFTYNNCVTKAAVDWYGCYCDAGGAAVACSLSLTPSTSTVTVSTGATIAFAASGGIAPATYSYSVAGTAGGSIDAVTGVYTAGGSVGIDTVTVSSAGCLDATATVNVINACTVTIAEGISIATTIGNVITLNASSTQGGPFTWAFTQQQTGSLNTGTGPSVIYSAGISGGIDKILVTDAGGCDPVIIVLNVSNDIVIVEIWEYSGGGCTSNPVDSVTAGNEVCVSVTLGDPLETFTWATNELDLGALPPTPGGTWGFWDGSQWTDSALSGIYQKIRYKTGGDLGTYSISSQDSESNVGNHLLNTCDMILSPTSPTMYVAGTLLFTATTGRTIASWATTDPGGTMLPAAPSTTSTYTPSTTGSFTITVTDNLGCDISTSVTVNPCPTINVSPATPSIVIGNNQAFGATGGTGPYTWSLGGTGIGTVDAAGIFTATNAGAVDIIATDDFGCEGSTTITVTCPIIDVTPDAQSVVVGSPNITYSASFGVAPYTWSTVPAASTIATVAALGPDTASVTIGTAGTITIRATDANSCVGDETLTVTCPATVVIAPANQTINIGDTIRLNASGGSNPYTWIEIDIAPAVNVGSIVQFSAFEADFTAANSGSVTITATDNFGCTGTTTVSVAASCSETISTSKFKVECDKRKLDIRATSDTQPDTLPLTFALFDPVGVQVWPAAGTVDMIWNADKSRYEYKVSDLTGLDTIPWTTSYEIRVYSQDCPSASPGTLGAELKNCP